MVSQLGDGMRRMLRAAAATVGVVMGVVVLTGCQGEPAPTGDALYADAEKTYFEYREFVNGVQSVLSTGPWRIVQLGDYGMQPGRCDDGTGYRFDLGRVLALDIADREKNADAITEYLTDVGVTPSRRTLGEGANSLVQIAVTQERGFELLLIEFGPTGDVRVSATTACRPGDAKALGDMLFGEVWLGQRYLPTKTEAPTDPLFFGITPGDPQFLITPTPTPTP